MKAPFIIDAHAHLAGLGHGGSGCFIARHKFHSLLYRFMRMKLGIYHAHREERLDQAYLERLDLDVSKALEHRALNAVVLFPHERIYDDHGDVLPRQELFVPNEYAFACSERPETLGRFLPAMSIHPYRRDALDETARWIERGAAAMKWLPNSQNIDPRDQRCLPLYDLLARHSVPLIAHTGGEHTVSICRPAYGDPLLLQPALDRGVTVILAHCGTRSGIWDTDWLPRFCEMARKYPRCYGDTSAFCTPGRSRFMGRILRENGVVEKLIHGSDYAVPPTAWMSVRKLGWRKTRELQSVWSFLERDIRIKRAMGFPDAVFTQAAGLLAPRSLKRFIPEQNNTSV